MPILPSPVLLPERASRQPFFALRAKCESDQWGLMVFTIHGPEGAAGDGKAGRGNSAERWQTGAPQGRARMDDIQVNPTGNAPRWPRQRHPFGGGAVLRDKCMARWCGALLLVSGRVRTMRLYSRSRTKTECERGGGMDATHVTR